MIGRFIPPLLTGLMLAFAPSGLAQTPSPEAPVQIQSVSFRYRQAPAQQAAPWLEAAIQFQVRAGNETIRTNPRFLDNVRLVLHLACQIQGERETSFQFYRNEVDFPTVEAGIYSVRFFLPPELVRRDRIQGEPYAFLVQVFAGDREIPMTGRNYSVRLSNPRVLQAFLQRSLAESPANQHLLMPQFLTPFAEQFQGEAPTFLRKSG